MRYVTEKQGREMCGEDENGDRIEGTSPIARRLTRKKAPLRDIQLLEIQKAKDSSPASLTLRDVELNAAGKTFRGDRRRYGKDPDGNRKESIVGNAVDRAMTKVDVWPSVGDTRAVRVGPLGVMDPQENDPTYSICKNPES